MEKISEIALFQQSETYALVVETRTTVKEIAMTIGRSFMEIETLFKEQNAVMADVPFVEYLNFESMSEDIHMIIGFKSAKILCGKGNIRAITIPGRKIVSCLHKGNYTELASLYREMQEWIAAKGYKPSGASIEYYYSKPGTSEEELATKVEMPVLCFWIKALLTPIQMCCILHSVFLMRLCSNKLFSALADKTNKLQQKRIFQQVLPKAHVP